MKSNALTNLLFGAGVSMHGYDFQPVSPVERESMARKILSDADALISNGSSLTFVELASAQTIYLITLDGHFAHPSILKRELVETSDSRRILVSGFTACDPEVMATWMAQFREQDIQMARASQP